MPVFCLFDYNQTIQIHSYLSASLLGIVKDLYFLNGKKITRFYHCNSQRRCTILYPCILPSTFSDLLLLILIWLEYHLSKTMIYTNWALFYYSIWSYYRQIHSCQLCQNIDNCLFKLGKMIYTCSCLNISVGRTFCIFEYSYCVFYSLDLSCYLRYFLKIALILTSSHHEQYKSSHQYVFTNQNLSHSNSYKSMTHFWFSNIMRSSTLYNWLS